MCTHRERMCWNTARRQSYAAKETGFRRNQPADTLTLTLSLQNCEICCLSHAVYGILLWQPKQTNIKNGKKKTQHFCKHSETLLFSHSFGVAASSDIALMKYNQKVRRKREAQQCMLSLCNSNSHLQIEVYCMIYVYFLLLDLPQRFDLLMQTKINLMKKNMVMRDMQSLQTSISLCPQVTHI